jgi:hypothetical protein
MIVNHRLRLLAFPTRASAASMLALADHETSQFPSKERAHMPVSKTTPGPPYVRFSSDNDQIADVPTRRIKCAPAARETACEPQVHPCAEQRSRTSRTRAPVALTDRGHANASFTLSIAGCSRFFTLTQSGLRPPR